MNYKSYKYHYLYKITNLLNKKYYVGIHSTNRLNDGYMGSGKIISKAINKYGHKNFKKEIIQFVNSREELILLEKQIVNENMIKDPMCYNMVLGGSNFLNKTIGKITVKDKDGNTFMVDVDDPKRLSGELKPILCGYRNVVDKDGNTYCVPVDDPRIKTGELFSYSKGKVTVYDKDGNSTYVNIDDPRYLSGELKFKCPNIDGRKNWRWVKKNGICKSIHKDELQSYLENGWKLGTNQKYPSSSKSKGGRYVHKDGICKLIRPEQLDGYLSDGWQLGMKGSH